jgi:CRP-like cAMP-binding protein
MENYFNSLYKVSLFKGIAEDNLSKLLSCLKAHTKKYDKDEFIAHEGDDVTEMGIVLSGRIIIVREDIFGNRNILSDLSEGDLFAEVLVSAHTEKMPVSVIVTEKCEIMFINYSSVINVCANSCGQHRLLVDNMITVLANKNIALGRKIEHLSKKTTREKLISYLTEQSHNSKEKSFSIPFNRQELADYLNVERSAMSNELSKLKKEGILSFCKSVFMFN